MVENLNLLSFLCAFVSLRETNSSDNNRQRKRRQQTFIAITTTEWTSDLGVPSQIEFC